MAVSARLLAAFVSLAGLTSAAGQCTQHNFTGFVVPGGPNPCPTATPLAAGGACSVACATGYFASGGNATVTCASSGAAPAIHLICSACTDQVGCASSAPAQCSSTAVGKTPCLVGSYGYYLANQDVATEASCANGVIGASSGSWDGGNESAPACVCGAGYGGGGVWVSGPTFPSCFAETHVSATPQAAVFLEARARNAAKLAAAQTSALALGARHQARLGDMADRNAEMNGHRNAEAVRAAAEVLARRPPLELPAECGLSPEEVVLLGR